MTILQSLNGYYDRMAARREAEPPGFSREKISFAITLDADGTPIAVTDLRVASGKNKKLQPQLLEVPAAVKRTAGIAPNRFWDKTSYALGRTAGDGRRTAEEHAAFKAVNRKLIANSNDPGLVAFARFLETWKPEWFDAEPFTPEMLDTNIVFQFDDDDRTFLHERDAACALLVADAGSDEKTEFCLVTGTRAPARRLHPTIKGVDGAQSSGAALVSFNLDAFTSYGKTQGANAPTSEAAAFRYGAALNRLLDRSSRNRLKRTIGDATVVFWADTSEAVKEDAAAAAEDVFADIFDPPAATASPEPTDDAAEAAKLRDALEKVASGRPVEEIDPRVHPKTEFHVLGLSPNAARLSVRYWLTDRFDVFVQRIGAHYRDLHIEPAPRGWGSGPSLNRLLANTTALQGKFDNIPPQLAGEVMRAVLSGAAYPQTLLAATVMRLRAGDNPRTGWHAAVIKACLNRPIERELARLRSESATAKRLDDLEKERLPVTAEADRTKDVPYNLGRLFAVLEAAQYAALGRVNAPIGDRYYAAASATPARVFGPLLRGLKNHVADARKRGRGGWIEPRVAEIMAMLQPNLPLTLSLEKQGRFAVGYYHEQAKRWEKADAGTPSEGEGDAASEEGGDKNG